MSDHILIEKSGGVLTLTMNRPDKKNALTRAMYQSLGDAIDQAAFDKEVRCVLIQANGAISEGNAEAAIVAITALAERVFTFYPFTPESMPENWQDILRVWLFGQPLAGRRVHSVLQQKELFVEVIEAMTF